MLFTRCPDCETTFRITAEALRKADGQVRCGRCACVFNGYTELRRRTRRRAGSGLDETAPGAFERVPAPENATAAAARRAGTQGEAHVLQLGVEAQSAALPAAKKPGEKPSDGVPAKAVPESASPQPGDSQKDTAVGEFSLAGVIAELEASAAPDTDPPDASSSPLGLLVKSGPEQAREAAVTGAGRGAHTSERSSALAAPSWVILDEARPQRIPPLAWKIGCGAAAALLLLQVLHHYRAELAVLGVVGPMVRQTYAALGSEIAPAWNIDQYQIEVDWDAVAQPNENGERNLKIAARIRNQGPRALPLPHVQVQLKDRWESTIGSRVFAPVEYLARGRSVDYVMQQGQSALAELHILDPGPQAYGFELDVCVDAANGALRCAADEVFR